MDYQVQSIYGKIKNPKQTVAVPGSKSVTARALLIAALASGRSTLCGAATLGDCAEFIGGLRSLGIPVKVAGNEVEIDGCGGTLPVKQAKVYVGSAGTAARFLTALAAFSDGEYTFDSSDQMKRRPIAPLINSLKDIGATFTFLGEQNCFPFVVKGAKNPATEVRVNIDKSSQFLSALLICAVCARKPVKIIVEGSHGMDYVKMTLDMMWSFGVDVSQSGVEYTVFGGYEPRRYDVEPDISAACYFYAMNAVLGTNIAVRGVMPHTMQGDYKLIQLLKTFDGGAVDMSSFSDQALTLAAIAPYLSRPTTITGIAHIRGQECDRINAICTNLSALGVKVEERGDGVKIYPSEPRGCALSSFGDHRVAMAFAVTGLRCGGVTIKNAEVCQKTFAGYFGTLDGLIKALTGDTQ